MALALIIVTIIKIIGNNKEHLFFLLKRDTNVVLLG